MSDEVRRRNNVIKALNADPADLFVAAKPPGLSFVENPDRFTGGLHVFKRFPNGHTEDVFRDNNLIVSMGRKVMSRMIGGLSGVPNITRTQVPGLRVVRGTTGGVASAWITFEQLTGTNDFQIQGHTDVTSPEWTITFVGGQQTLSTLATAISAQGTNVWAASATAGMESVDAVSLVPTGGSFCIGSASTYSSIPADSIYARTLYAISTSTEEFTTSQLADLAISRLRFGTQGHIDATPTLGKDVLASDEYLTAALLAVDLGNSLEAEDYLECTVSYPNTAQVAFTATLQTTQGNGLYVSEAGLFNSLGHMIARKNFGQIYKSNLFEMVAVWTLVF